MNELLLQILRFAAFLRNNEERSKMAAGFTIGGGLFLRQEHAFLVRKDGSWLPAYTIGGL